MLAFMLSNVLIIIKNVWVKHPIKLKNEYTTQKGLEKGNLNNA